MVRPSIGPSGSTRISTVYERGSPCTSSTGLRSGSNLREAKTRSSRPAVAQGSPTFAISKNVRLRVPYSATNDSRESSPFTAIVVLVPRIVQSPPRIVAYESGSIRCEGENRSRRAQSDTAGMSIATTGVLFMNAESAAAGVSSRPAAPRGVEGCPSKSPASRVIPPVWRTPSATM